MGRMGGRRVRWSANDLVGAAVHGDRGVIGQAQALGLPRSFISLERFDLEDRRRRGRRTVG